MGVDISSVLMIGEMFKNDDNTKPLGIDYDILEDADLDWSGDHMSENYMCVGKILSYVDIYMDVYSKIDVNSYDHIREEIERRLQKIFPDRNPNVGMYHITDIS